MEDDEEVVLKNSALYSCLIEAGFRDFESVERSDLQCSSKENIENSSILVVTNNDYSTCQEHESYIQLCLRSKLLFADDASLVENYIASLHSPPPPSIMSSMLKVVSYVAVGGAAYNACRFLNTNVRLAVFLSLPAVPLAINCVRRSFFAYQKFRRKKIIYHLLSCLKEISLFSQKSVQYILNNSVLAFTLDKHRIDHENSEYFLEVVFSTLRSTILELKSVIVSLVQDFPLKEPAESRQYHLAFLSDEDLHCVRPDGTISPEYLQKMKYTCFLLQSELLRRVCLCLVPNLLANRSHKSISQIFQRLRATSDTCGPLCQRLKSTFEMHYLLEKSPVETKIRQSSADWTHREAYIKLCSLSFNLQSVLRESRHLERMLEDVSLRDANHDHIVAFLDDGVRRIDLEYAKCQSVLDDFRKYVMSLRPKQNNEPQMVITSSSFVVPEANKTNIILGVTDFRPQWPDEVFVGISDVDVQHVEMNEIQLDNVGNPCAKLLISELKMALRDKAEEWKEREREALKNKNVEENSENEDELPIIKHSTIESSYQKRPLPFLDVVSIDRDIGRLPESSFAKQIAAVSVLWQKRDEQHFSFGDDDDDTDDHDE